MQVVQTLISTTKEEFVSSVSPKGQITIPMKLRRRWGIKAKDKVALLVEGDQVRLQPAKFTLETVYGSVTPRTPSTDFRKISHIARDEHAKKSL